MVVEILINYGITLIIGVLSFLLNRYFSIYFGVEQLGLMKLFSQMLGYLNLVEMGLASASAYALYEPLLKKKYNEISIIIHTISYLYNKIFVLITLVGVILSPLIPFLIKKTTLSNRYICYYWILYILGTAVNYLYIKYSILITADQNYKFVKIIQGISRIVGLLLQFITIIYLKSIMLFIAVLMIENILKFIVYRFYYIRKYNYITHTKLKNFSIIANLKNLFFHKLATVIVFSTDLILISKFVSLETVGIYGSYQMVVQLINTQVTTLLNILRPRIGKFIAMESKDQVFEYWKRLNIIFLFISMVIVMSARYLISDFIYLWLGSDFYLSNITIDLILVNLFINSFRGVLELFKEGSGFFNDIQLPILEALINFVLSMILVLYIGLNGIILGTIVSNVIIVCIAKPILVFKKCFNGTFVDYVKIYTEYLFLILIGVIGIRYIMSFVDLFNVETWSEWVLRGMVVFSTIFIFISMVFLSHKDFRKYFRRFSIK